MHSFFLPEKSAFSSPKKARSLPQSADKKPPRSNERGGWVSGGISAHRQRGCGGFHRLQHLTGGFRVGSDNELGQQGQHQAGEKQNDGAAQAGGDLREGHQLHAVGSRQHGHVAGAAHVGHAQAGSDTGFEGIEAHQLADEGRAHEGADAGGQAQQQVGDGEAADHGADIQIADTDAHQQHVGQVLHDELEPLIAGHLHALGHDVGDLADGHGDDHPGVGVNGDAGAQGIPQALQDEAPGEEPAGDQQADAHLLEVNVIALLLHFGADFQFLGIHVAGLHQLAVAVHLALDDLDQHAGHHDGDGVADGHGGGHDGQGLGGAHGRAGFKDLGKRGGAGAHAAAHDGQGDEQQGVHHGIAHDGRHAHAQAEGQDQTAEDGREVTGRGLHQQFAVHAQDGAGDQGGDVPIQEAAGGLEEGADVAHQVQGAQGQLHISMGKQAEVHQQAGAEDAHDGAAAQVVLDDGGMIADPGQDLAQHHHEQEAAGHALGQHAQIGGKQANHGHDQKNGPGKRKEGQGLFRLGLCTHRIHLHSIFGAWG